MIDKTKEQNRSQSLTEVVKEHRILGRKIPAKATARMFSDLVGGRIRIQDIEDKDIRRYVELRRRARELATLEDMEPYWIGD